MAEQSARAALFDRLHARPGLFVISNPWDAGSAKMLASLGFEALATTSAGFAFSLGMPDAEGAVVRAVAPRPLNVVVGLSGSTNSLDGLAAPGVKRVSLGSTLARAAYGASLRAAREIRGEGTFTFAGQAVSYAEINGLFKLPPPST